MLIRIQEAVLEVEEIVNFNKTQKMKINLIILLTFCIFSCKSENEKIDDLINEKSSNIFNNSKDKIKLTQYLVNIDSFNIAYEKCKSENPQRGLDFANRFSIYSDKLSLKKVEDDIKKKSQIAQEIEKKEKEKADYKRSWENSKYGKLQKKHPDWSEDDCINVMSKKIWVGMSYEMLVYQRGKPNTVNPSNYGNGTEYQCCWDDYSPSCFYMKQDNIIYSYN